jgi:hypothetical protein
MYTWPREVVPVPLVGITAGGDRLAHHLVVGLLCAGGLSEEDRGQYSSSQAKKRPLGKGELIPEVGFWLLWHPSTVRSGGLQFLWHFL